jgi:hypothetical protein
LILQNYCNFGSEYVSGWAPVSLLVILTVITVLSLLYSLSPFLGVYGRKLKIQLKEEFVQAVISIFLISSIFVILKLFCDISSGDPFQQSEGFLQRLLIKGINLYVEGYLYEVRFLILGTLFENVPPLQVGLQSGGLACGGVTSTPFINLLVTVDTIINGFITISYASIYFILLVLAFAREYAFSVILPIGIICRVIPQTRRAADFFIALSIGLYIFLPAILLMNDSLVQQIKPQQIETPPAAKDLVSYLSSFQYISNTLLVSAINIFKVGDFSNFIREVAWYYFFAVFMLGIDISLLTTFVETLGNALSIGFGSLSTRMREAYAPG